jgi:hypothetical protein
MNVDFILALLLVEPQEITQSELAVPVRFEV